MASPKWRMQLFCCWLLAVWFSFRFLVRLDGSAFWSLWGPVAEASGAADTGGDVSRQQCAQELRPPNVLHDILTPEHLISIWTWIWINIKSGFWWVLFIQSSSYESKFLQGFFQTGGAMLLIVFTTSESCSDLIHKSLGTLLVSHVQKHLSFFIKYYLHCNLSASFLPTVQFGTWYPNFMWSLTLFLGISGCVCFLEE